MRRELGMLAALVLLCIALFVSNSDFLGASNVVNVARHISSLGILSIGVAFVIITGGIDLSIGSVIGLVGCVMARLLTQQHWSVPATLATVLLLSALIGLAHGLLITKVRLQPFV